MASVAQIINTAKAQIGKPYVYGQDGPSTFDCSGLITYIFGMAGISLPHNAAAQQYSPKVQRVSNPQPGDLVFYGNPAHHVALYLGNGRQIAAPHSGANVMEQNVSSGATYGRVVGLTPASFTDIIGGLENVGDKTVSSTFSLDNIFQQIEGTTINLAVGLLGVALVGVGLWFAVAPKAKNAVKSTLSNVGFGGSST